MELDKSMKLGRWNASERHGWVMSERIGKVLVHPKKICRFVTEEKVMEAAI